MEIVKIDKKDIFWLQLLAISEDYQSGSLNWLTLQRENFISSYTIVAIDNDEIIGFMRFSIREIVNGQGDLVTCDNQVLLEAFGEALGVKPDKRNKGIGGALQQKSFEMARSMGCYQFRSALYKGADVLQHIKISMNCAIHSERGITYFVKVL